MKTEFFTRTLITSLMVFGLGVGVAPICRADVYDPDAAVESASTGEHPNGPARPVLDPFAALIQPPEAVVPIPTHIPVVVPTPAPAPPDPPVQFRVESIAGESGNYLAVIEYAGESYIVGPGQKVPDTGPAVLEVRAVTDQQVDVWDPKLQRLVQKTLAN